MENTCSLRKECNLADLAKQNMAPDPSSGLLIERLSL
jgi:hypothetical protein